MTILQRISLAEGLCQPDLALIPEAEGRSKLAKLKNDLDLVAAINQVTAEMQSLPGYRPVASSKAGIQRTVFIGKDTVVKVPLVGYEFSCYYEDPVRYLERHDHPSETSYEFHPKDNVEANLIEVAAFETEGCDAPVAPCKLVWHYTGIPIVVMEKVQLISKKGGQAKPDWMNTFEQNQIGWSKTLRGWAAYDAGVVPDYQLMNNSKWLAFLNRTKKAMLRKEAKNQLALA